MLRETDEKEERRKKSFAFCAKFSLFEKLETLNTFFFVVRSLLASFRLLLPFFSIFLSLGVKCEIEGIRGGFVSLSFSRSSRGRL